MIADKYRNRLNALDSGSISLPELITINCINKVWKEI